METSLNRNEKMIAVLALSAILGFILTFLYISSRTAPSVSQIDTRSQINYQMARPEEGYSEYSLIGREVDQSYEALAQKKKQPAAQNKLKTTPNPVAAVANAKKIEAAKKAAQLQQARQAQARAAQTAAQAKRSAMAEAAQQQNAQSGSQQTETKAPTNENNGRDVLNAKNQGQLKKSADPVTAKPKKKTFAEWRALVFAQPTQETINTFLAAYRKGDVSSTEVQVLAQDLLDQNSESLKGLGLYALRATPSLASFSQLVHIEAEVSETYKSYIQQAYLSYLQPQNMGVLNQALQTKDKVLVLKSLNLLSINLQKVVKGDFTAFADPRNGRESGPGDSVSMTSFKGLISALSTLGSSQDQELAPLAQQVISYIQSTNTVAQIN